MSFFSDKDYSQIDWLGQICLPYEWSLISWFNSLPDSRELSVKQDIINKYYPSHLGLSRAVHAKNIFNTAFNPIQPFEVQWIYNTLFSMELSGQVLTPDTDIILKITKNPKAFSTDEAIMAAWKKHAEERLNDSAINMASNGSRFYLYDLLNMTGATSKKVSGSVLKLGLIKIFAENTWNVRNLDLLNQAITWVISYLETGNNAAIVNLSKLQCMSHFGKPIYSMEVIV